ncbi:MAG: quinone-dependent dihydroorotate dehydrogenase [Flavobacteriales bacterium]
MYALLRPLLFLFDPERAHGLTFKMLEIAKHIPGALALVGGKRPPLDAAVEVMGLKFPGPVGLAAGMDKNAEHVDALARIGFGHVEIGTVTPVAQPGNDKPRLFRLKPDRALINRMGFNNHGAHSAAQRLSVRPRNIIVGGNIGKNKSTPNENAVDDYVKCFEALYPAVDYFVVNVSSPNTPGLRALQEKGPLLGILRALNERNGAQPAPKPMLLKIAPDLTDEQLDDVVAVVKESGIQGVVATNTTIGREGLVTAKAEVDRIGPGGLSGVPVRARSTEIVRYLRDRLPRPMVVIGVGGIDSADSAIEKLEAGADLLQVYSGLVYEGPALLKRINEAYVHWRR